MAIEAISGLSSAMSQQASQAAQSANVQSPTSVHQSEAAPSSEAADSFRETLGKLHDDLAKFQPDASQNAAKADPVEAAKADMLPSPWKTASAAPSTSSPSPAGSSASSSATSGTSATSDGNNVLRKSFDHAIYVTLVSQVVGGLSQTTSTLIKQQ